MSRGFSRLPAEDLDALHTGRRERYKSGVRVGNERSVYGAQGGVSEPKWMAFRLTLFVPVIYLDCHMSSLIL